MYNYINSTAVGTDTGIRVLVRYLSSVDYGVNESLWSAYGCSSFLEFLSAIGRYHRARISRPQQMIQMIQMIKYMSNWEATKLSVQPCSFIHISAKRAKYLHNIQIQYTLTRSTVPQPLQKGTTTDFGINHLRLSAADPSDGPVFPESRRPVGRRFSRTARNREAASNPPNSRAII